MYFWPRCPTHRKRSYSPIRMLLFTYHCFASFLNVETLFLSPLFIYICKISPSLRMRWKGIHSQPYSPASLLSSLLQASPCIPGWWQLLYVYSWAIKPAGATRPPRQLFLCNSIFSRALEFRKLCFLFIFRVMLYNIVPSLAKQLNFQLSSEKTISMWKCNETFLFLATWHYNALCPLLSDLIRKNYFLVVKRTKEREILPHVATAGY